VFHGERKEAPRGHPRGRIVRGVERGRYNRRTGWNAEGAENAEGEESANVQERESGGVRGCGVAGLVAYNRA
jgi:hypothetical protein